MQGTLIIVAQENDEGFIGHTFPFQEFQQVAQGFVHPFHQRGVAQGFAVFQAVRLVVPRKAPVHLKGVVDSIMRKV